MSEDKLPREDEFLLKLTALSKECGIVIGACGCCDSPWLISGQDAANSFGRYIPDPYDIGFEAEPPEIPEFKL